MIKRGLKEEHISTRHRLGRHKKYMVDNPCFAILEGTRNGKPKFRCTYCESISAYKNRYKDVVSCFPCHKRSLKWPNNLSIATKATDCKYLKTHFFKSVKPYRAQLFLVHCMNAVKSYWALLTKRILNVTEMEARETVPIASTYCHNDHTRNKNCAQVNACSKAHRTKPHFARYFCPLF